MTTLHQDHPEWPITRLCALFAVPRSSWYYQSSEPSLQEDEALKHAIQETAGAWPTYGVRRITHQLKRDAAPLFARPIGQRKVHRLMRQMGLCAKVKVRKKRTTNSEHGFSRYPNLVQGLAAHSPDHIWVADITYIVLGNGFVYLAVILDVFTRCIRGWCLSRHLDGELTLAALRQALLAGTPEIHHSDQGVQYAATDYVVLLQTSGVLVSMANVGCPEENGFAERLMRTIKEEHVTLTEYSDIQDARSQIGHFLEEVYQTKRIHSALGYLTPKEFERSYQTRS